MTPHDLAGLRPPTGLADTRRPHLCPRCAFYAYHADQHPVRVGLRVHHPACATVRKTRLRTRVGADAPLQGNAPSPLPILATTFGIFVATLNIAKSKGP